jgi:hypothetical protein
MPTATIFRDGKAIRTTSLTADQSQQFIVLADVVKAAQGILRNKPEISTEGDGLKTGKTDAGVPYSTEWPDDIYTALARIDELVGRNDPRDNWPWLESGFGTRTGSSGVPRWMNEPHAAAGHPALRAIRPDGNYTALAQTLGMVPTDELAFDRSELTDPGPAAVTESGGAKVGGTGVPVIRAYVRWRP